MQIQAIFEATAMALREKVDVRPEIMIPQVCTRQELIWVKERVRSIHKEVEKRYNVKIKYKFGTMMEVVRACSGPPGWQRWRNFSPSAPTT